MKLIQHSDYLIAVTKFTGTEIGFKLEDEAKYGGDYTITKMEHVRDYCTKDMFIVAHLPLNNAPLLEGVDLLPSFIPIGSKWRYNRSLCQSPTTENLKVISVINGLVTFEQKMAYESYGVEYFDGKTFTLVELPKQEDGLEMMAMDYADTLYDGRKREQISKFNGAKCDFKAGYKANTNKYSEEDMIDFMTATSSTKNPLYSKYKDFIRGNPDSTNKEKLEWYKSLATALPTEFIPEMEIDDMEPFANECAEEVVKLVENMYSDIIVSYYDDKGESQIDKLKKDILTQIQSLSTALPTEFIPEYDLINRGNDIETVINIPFSRDGYIYKTIKVIYNEVEVNQICGTYK